jgi:LAS superfamily LD-carboxypeptidase LdcB
LTRAHWKGIGLNELELTGRARTHIVQLERPRCALHRDVVEPFLALRDAAAREGIDLRPYSAFRDFDTQVLIWNRKWRGERALYDRAGRLLEHARLTEAELIEAILGWSALPGASRHHWGSEIDLYDAAAVPADYRLQLLPEEYGPAGPFGRLTDWLGANLTQFGFFRPYDVDRGGVHAEPWHVSFAAVSVPALAALSPDVLARALASSDLLGKPAVLARLARLHERYIANVAVPGATPVA